MIHPLLHLVATKPHLIADHVAAYADLVAEEMGAAFSRWKMRFVLRALALFLMAVSVVLFGVALMLWAVIPPSEIHAAWALIAAPAAPLIVAVVCFAIAGMTTEVSGFEHIRQQVQDDLAMLRRAGTS